MSNSSPTLRPTLGFIGVLAYGVGDILGAGIYALVGEVTSVAGEHAWMSFVTTLVIASFTALSYAELSSRIPKSGGEAMYCLEAYGRKRPAFIIGWFVLCSGIVSCATVSVAFSGYLTEALSTSNGWVSSTFILMFIAMVGGVAMWGMKQSSALNIVCTCIEMSGILFVISIGLLYLANGNGGESVASTTTESPIELSNILRGSALAFFAFIGFEDIVNVAEETHSPRRYVPAAILTALAVAGVLYVAVAWTATTVVDTAILSESKAPLLEVVRVAAPDFPLPVFSMVALFAITNTGMLNLVMGSRLLYGMSTERLVPVALGRIHPRTHTPYRAIIALCIVVAILALSGTLGMLAGTTNTLLLLVFISVHLSLIGIKKKPAREIPAYEEKEIFHIPRLVPWIGGTLCAGLIFLIPLPSLLTASALVALGIFLSLLHNEFREQD